MLLLRQGTIRSGNQKSDKSYLSPADKRVLVKRGNDEYKYTFYDKGLASLEFLSPEKKIKAICDVPETHRTGDHPPGRLSTRVTDSTTDMDTSKVEIQYKNVKRNVTIPTNTFSF